MIRCSFAIEIRRTRDRTIPGYEQFGADNICAVTRSKSDRKINAIRDQIKIGICQYEFKLKLGKYSLELRQQRHKHDLSKRHRCRQTQRPDRIGTERCERLAN